MSRRTRSQWFSAASSWGRRRSTRSFSARPEARRLRIERLEERTLLAVFSVTNIDDSGAGSLRQSVLDANSTAGADTIAFSSLFDTPQTINLTSAQLTLTDAATTTITGTGAHRLVVSGSGQRRVFEIGAGASASLSGLTITGGNAVHQGGGLFNSGTVSLTKVAVRDNVALITGGGLFNNFNGTMTLVDCTISGNGIGPFAGFVQGLYLTPKGGGVINYGTLSMTNCTVSGNAAIRGGGLFNERYATLVNCTVSGNRASGTAGVDSLDGQPVLTMYNTIVSGNLGSDLLVLEPPLGPGVVGSNNLIGGDAKLGMLGDYGGPMLTMMPAADSPAHGAGTTTVPGGIPGIPATDQMGNIRPAQPAIGAMEGNYSLVVTTTFSNRGSDPGQVSLTAAVHRANMAAGPNTIQFSSLFDTPQTIVQNTAMVVTDPAVTTLDGQGRLTIQGHGGIRVKLGSLALSGVTLTGGSTVLRNLGGDITLSGVTVTGNHAINQDAVIHNGGQDPSVLYTFNGPSGANDGIPRDPYSLLPVQTEFGGTMTLTGCTISDNDGGFEAAIINNRSVFVVATGLVHEASLTITECTISGNGKFSSLFPNMWNGGLLTMSRSTVRDNKVQIYGGGLYNIRVAMLTDCTFSGNSAGATGGGVMNQIGGTLTMTNCTLDGNTAGFSPDSGLPLSIRSGLEQITVNVFGGGGLANTGTATLANCTISNNVIDPYFNLTAPSLGGGLLNFGTVTLTNSIVAANILSNPDTPSDIINDFDGTVSSNSGNNLIGTGGSGGLTNGVNGNLVGVDPLLGTLADYGGPTWTRPPLAGSPAIDAGDPFFHSASTGILYDQRGLPRVVRGAAQTETNDVVGLAEIKFGATGGLIVTPTDAFASTYFSGLQLPVNLIDNSGLDTTSGNVLTYTHAPDGSAIGMWAAGNGQGGGNPAPVVNDQYIVLDLGANHDLSQAYLWQMVQTNLLGRGIKEFRLYGSPAAPSAADKANPPAVYDLTDYSLLLDTTTLAPGPQSGQSTTQAFALTNATDVRTIYIDVISSYNTGPRIDIGAVEAPKWFVATSGEFFFDGSQPSVRFTLSDVVGGASVSPSDVQVVRNNPINIGFIPATGGNSDGATVTFTLPTDIVEGLYTATLPAGSITDPAGNPLSVPLSFQFYSFLRGDYNRNGEVDAADYVVWRKTLGTTEPLEFAGADGSGNSIVGPEDHGVWAANFGNTTASAGAAAVEVAHGATVAFASAAGDRIVAEPSRGDDDVFDLPIANSLTIEGRSESQHERVWSGIALMPRSLRTTSSNPQVASSRRSYATPLGHHDAALVAWLATCNVPSRPGGFPKAMDGLHGEDSAETFSAERDTALRGRINSIDRDSPRLARQRTDS